MRRVFGVMSAVALLGFGSLAQFSGVWEAMIQIVPGIELEECVLTLNYKVNKNWTISSISEFDETGLIEQSFGLRGSFAFLSITGGMSFNPADTSTVVVHYPNCDPQTGSYTLVAPAYKEAWIKTSFTLAGAELSLEFHHWAYPYHMEDIDEDGVDDYVWPCCPPQTQSYTLFSIIVGVPPLSLKINLADCCAGFSFRDATFSLIDVPICCGLTYDAELFFTKMGFGHFEIAVELEICCGISIEVATRFTVDHKRVTITPKWDGLGQACFVLYGNVVTGEAPWEIGGIEIYGYKIRCDLSPCSYVELMTALDVTKLEDLLDDPKLFEDNEFEYWKLGFCGPGCCGSIWSLALAVYFQPAGSLFGLTRIKGDLSVPIMANFDLRLSLGVEVGGGTELAVGWAFRF